MVRIIALYSMKGGVGKTTIAANLAYGLAVDLGLKTLLWDIDAQGAASFLLSQERAGNEAQRVFSREVEPSALIAPTRWPGFDLLAADLSLRHLDQDLSEAGKPKRLRKILQTLARAYDRILLDCPPGLGEISDQLFRAVDLVVIPVPPTPLALRSLTQVEAHLERNHDRRPSLLPVTSMVDRRKAMHREFVAAHPAWPTIPHASVVERMALERAPLATYAGRSAAAKAFTMLNSAVEAHLTVMPDSAQKPTISKLARIPKHKR